MKTGITSLKINNFKFIRNKNKALKLTPLTAFIGNNGSGKSAVVEALEFIKELEINGIDSRKCTNKKRRGKN